ncbi:MAG TPA: tyrosinase family protein [Thermoanaerobaculia bacterium]|nr:tyrosinase family protein [Thermoanaerobaculia bacterium]
MLRRTALLCSLLAAALAAPAAAGPVPCSGGTLDFTATSDTPFTLPTFNVGQQTTLTAVTTGFTATSFSWTIPPPHIKDYNDDLGTMMGLATPLAWSTTPLSPADLSASTVTFYWKPSAAQTFPLNGPPEARMVSLMVTPSAGGTCTSSATFMIERNSTDPDKQPEDFYTSTHRAMTATNAGDGHVIDEHIYWHQFVHDTFTDWRYFLAWHGFFLRRFDSWRQEFGYAQVAPWYPGRPLPTGPEFDAPAALRLAFDPDSNRIPTYYTLAGGTASDGGRHKLADYPTVNAFTSSFEGSYHGVVHCNIGSHVGGFFDHDGPGFGSMCNSSSPKDPMFWRWHGFIDTLYRNVCKLSGSTCFSGPDPAADPWMGDNAADIAANGVPPSPAPHWLSPDIWNRRSAVTTDACVPRDGSGHLITVGGVTRDCGTSADHENPLSGTPNFLYATLRNNAPTPRNVYAEVAVYIANASTGLSWPADFTMLPESRQFITLFLDPGQTTSIGPLPWTPPSPVPSDHFCIYIRVLTVQEPPLVEGSNIDTNVANSNSISWRNLKIVDSVMGMKSARFIVRNIQRETQPLTLQIEIPPALLQAGRLAIRLDNALLAAFKEGKGRTEGLKAGENGTFFVTSPKARINGLLLASRKAGAAEVALELGKEAVGDVTVTQISAKGVDGGVTMRVAKRRAEK